MPTGTGTDGKEVRILLPISKLALLSLVRVTTDPMALFFLDRIVT